MSRINFERTAEDYAKYRMGFPPELFQRLQAYSIGLPGQRVLDVGTGTGTLARGFAQQGCEVFALDPAPTLMHYARQQDEEEQVRVRYLRARGEQTALASDSFDVVTAGQCWHWLDRPTAAQEIWRLLASGGALVIAHFDWVALPGNAVEATLRLIQDYNPEWNPGAYHLTQQGLYPAWLHDVAAAGYTDIETFSFDVNVSYTHKAWCGRIRASAGVVSMPPEIVVQFDSALKDLLWMNYPSEPLAVPHRVWALVCRR